MIQQGKFGIHEAVSLITIVIITKVFFTSPALLISFTGTANWYATLISAGTALIGFTFVYLLLKDYPGRNLIEIFEIVLGRYIGFIFSGIFSLWFIFIAAAFLREFAEVLTVYVLPLSPLSFIIGMFVFGTTILSFMGLESIVRFAKLSSLVIFVGYISVQLLSWEYYELHRIFPIYGYGIKNTLLHGITRSSAYGEAVILAVFAGSLQGVQHIKRAGYAAIFISGLLVSSALLSFTLVFPYTVAQEITSLMYQMTRLIDYGRFVQRLDPIFFFIWNIGTFIAITTIFYTGVSIYCHMFRIQDIKPVLIPSNIILFAAAMIPKDMSIIIMGYVQGTRQYGWIIYFLMPLIVLIISRLRRKKIKKGAVQV